MADPLPPHRHSIRPLQQLALDLQSNNLADYNWIAPDQYNDQHSSLTAGYGAFTGDHSSIAAGDNFVARVVRPRSRDGRSRPKMTSSAHRTGRSLPAISEMRGNTPRMSRTSPTVAQQHDGLFNIRVPLAFRRGKACTCACAALRRRRELWLETFERRLNSETTAHIHVHDPNRK
jgi:hypothetical protein